MFTKWVRHRCHNAPHIKRRVIALYVWHINTCIKLTPPGHEDLVPQDCCPVWVQVLPVWHFATTPHSLAGCWVKDDDVVVVSTIHQEVDVVIQYYGGLNGVAVNTLKAVHWRPGVVIRVIAMNDVRIPEEVPVHVELPLVGCCHRLLQVAPLDTSHTGPDVRRRVVPLDVVEFLRPSHFPADHIYLAVHDGNAMSMTWFVHAGDLTPRISDGVVTPDVRQRLGHAVAMISLASDHVDIVFYGGGGEALVTTREGSETVPRLVT